ncbi:MAG: hypothetical protein SGI94_05335 [Saprospiraceae bacterium]|nr:hypothetical protein [Saprospiraceae bacterium]
MIILLPAGIGLVAAKNAVHPASVFKLAIKPGGSAKPPLKTLTILLAQVALLP